MTYPASDHCNGTHFFNPESGAGRRRSGFWRFLRLRFSRDETAWARWPLDLPNRVFAPPAPAPSLTFIGHSSFLLRLPGLTLLTDPVFSARCSPIRFIGPRRVRAPGLALADLPHIDAILLSHNHYDHMDLPSLRALRARFPGAALIAPLGNATFLARQGLPGAIELDWWQSFEHQSARLTLTPARHFAARTLFDRNRTLWGGFYIEQAGHSLYFAGDTGYTAAFTEIRARLGAPSLALLPIGAYEPRAFMSAAHMNPADAVQAFRDLGATRAIGMHFGTFQLTAEPLDAPERDLATARAEAGLDPARFTTLEVGETMPL